MADDGPAATPRRAEARRVVRFAPAKINLYLHVTGRRDDGYHLLDSLMAFAGVGDDIAVESAPGLSLVVDGPFAEALSDGPDNLVLRAAGALARHAGVAAGARVRLTKRLPVASGIGGGSADAAAALRALADLWRIDVPEADLLKLGLALGADVPICLFGRAAFVGGIGEAIAPAPPLPAAWLVLVNPGVTVSTAAVFRTRRGGYSAPGRFTEAPADVDGLADLLARRGNDLAETAIRLAPAVGDALAVLGGEAACRLARMSGSGATCFGLFGDEASAGVAATRIAGARPQWWVRAAPLIGDAAIRRPPC